MLFITNSNICLNARLINYDYILEDIDEGFSETYYCEQRFYYIDSYVCPIFALETNDLNPGLDMKKFFRHFPKAKGEKDPKFNIFAWREEEKMIVIFIPRSKHRPECYHAEGDAQCLVSPGALDMAGVLVTARPEDFERINADKARDIIREVGLPFDEAEAIANKYNQ